MEFSGTSGRVSKYRPNMLLNWCYAILVTASCLKTTIIHAVLLSWSMMLCYCETQTSMPRSEDGLANDRRALLYFKTLITEDPSGILSGWNSSAADVCMWQGVRCRIINGTGGVPPSQRRVTELNLISMNLLGRISPSLSNITFLTILSLARNRLHGNIPPVLGLLCSKQNPKERLGIEDAIKELNSIRENYSTFGMSISKSAYSSVAGFKPVMTRADGSVHEEICIGEVSLVQEGYKSSPVFQYLIHIGIFHLDHFILFSGSVLSFQKRKTIKTLKRQN